LPDRLMAAPLLADLVHPGRWHGMLFCIHENMDS
jgi:hypothetical protein